jgi:hypothetical protein
VALVAIGTSPAAQQAGKEKQTAEAATTVAERQDADALEKKATQVFDEKFDNNDSGVSVEPSDGTKATIEGGVYKATLDDGGFRSVYSKRELQDFIVEVECKTLVGGDSGECGVVFNVKEIDGQKDNDENYFYVKGGKYGVYTSIGGKTSGLNTEKSHEAIKSGDTNIVKLVHIDGEARLYVNDVLIEKIPDADLKLKGGGVGFAVSASGGDAVVQVDNWKLLRFQ